MFPACDMDHASSQVLVACAKTQPMGIYPLSSPLEVDATNEPAQHDIDHNPQCHYILYPHQAYPLQSL